MRVVVLRSVLSLCCYIGYSPASLCDICCQDALQVLHDVWQVLLVSLDQPFCRSVYQSVVVCLSSCTNSASMQSVSVTFQCV
jgi:hypothetical protein